MATVAAQDESRSADGGLTSSLARPWIAAVLSAVLPGLGQAYLGRYRRAGLWISPAVLGLVGGYLVLDWSITSVVSASLNPTVLWGVVGLTVLSAVWRTASAVDAYRTAPTDARNSTGRVAVAVGWIILAFLISAPHLVVGRYTLDAISLVDSVFIADNPTRAETPIIPIGTDAAIVPDPAATPSQQRSEREYESIVSDSMWDPDAVAARIKIAGDRTAPRSAPFLPFSERVGDTRITILIAGGDAGPGRGGLRTDSMIVASLNMTTGKAVLFGFPRNLGSIPLPKKFEGAFVDLEKRLAPVPDPPVEGEAPEEPPEWVSCKCFPQKMNAIYPFTRNWTRSYPNEIDPGMAALRDVIEKLMDVHIDYYILVDMAAFVDLVDAVGGIDVNVRKPLKADVSPPREGDPWAKVDVEVGWNHLSGSEALAYVRARKGSSDYTRMERQRCMLRGIAAKADPFTILKAFPAIVDAVSGSVVTDIPRSFVAEFLSAASTLDFDDIHTVGFTHAYWLEERDHLSNPIPDVDRIRSKVRRVFAGQDEGEAVESGTSECDA